MNILAIMLATTVNFTVQTAVHPDDFKTYDLLRDYALDEEEDMYWLQEQLELIEKIGLQNWLVSQL